MDYICVMSKYWKYRFNSNTLSYEMIKEKSAHRRLFKSIFLFLGSVAAAVFYVWIYTSVLGNELPKTVILRKTNARWSSKVEVMNRQLDRYDEVLSALSMRDNDIYRAVFGMYEIPDEVRNAGYGGVNRYSYLDYSDCSGLLRSTVVRLDVLTKKTFVQSKSFDEITAIARHSGDMALCVPALSPICPVPGSYHISSYFGSRTDPVYGHTAFHEGMDFAIQSGNAVYATADGVVEKVRHEFFGYGNSVLVDHGFGYKTRYAHMKTISVHEGEKVRRGSVLGESGNSGKSTGPHLHYEVIYKGKAVNPLNYVDLSMDKNEYMSLVESASEQSGQS